MPLELDSTAAGFERDFARLLDGKRETAADVDAAVQAIVADVRVRGDAALIDLTRRFDRLDLTVTPMRVSASEIETAQSQCSRETLAALDVAAGRIEAYHRRLMPQDLDYTDAAGVFTAYAQRHPDSSLAPDFAARAIAAYRQGGFEELVAEQEESYVSAYAPGTPYWHGAQPTPEVQAEVAHDLRGEAAATGAASLSRQYRVYTSRLEGRYLDIRGQRAARPDVYASDDYAAGQGLGEAVRASGGAGVLFDSLRHAGGINVVAHRPRNVQDVTQGDHYELTVSAASRRIEARKLAA